MCRGLTPSISSPLASPNTDIPHIAIPKEAVVFTNCCDCLTITRGSLFLSNCSRPAPVTVFTSCNHLAYRRSFQITISCSISYALLNGMRFVGRPSVPLVGPSSSRAPPRSLLPTFFGDNNDMWLLLLFLVMSKVPAFPSPCYHVSPTSLRRRY